MNPIKVMLVDDHSVMRKGLSALLGTCPEIQVCAEASNGADGIRKALEHRPDVIIMDLLMPEMDGIDATRLLLSQWPDAKVLVLTTVGSSDTLSQALEAGATGALLKSAELDELCEAIAATSAGERYLSSEILQILSDDPPAEKLSPRQAEILKSIVDGQTNADIARQLGISIQMVKAHVTRLLKKLGAVSRTEAAAIALKKHLLKI